MNENELKKFSEAMLERLSALRAAGALIAINYGTGDMSLRTLTAVPVDVIKVDQSVTHGEMGSLLPALEVLASHLGAAIVAVGVESDEQHDAVINNNIAFAEGFHYALPTDPGSTESAIHGWSAGFGSLVGRSLAK